MREVSPRTASLLVDSLERRGLDPFAVWSGLPIDRERLRSDRERLDWDVWVEMMQRAEDACGGPSETERLFAKGAGTRMGHPFVRLARAFLKVEELYALFARWGLDRNLMMHARFEPGIGSRADFLVTIDADRKGSLPTIRYIAGVLRHLPGLQDLPDAEVRLVEATPHRGRYELQLPRSVGVRARVQTTLAHLRGAPAALDELAAQAAEIHDKNIELERQLHELQQATASLRERDEWLGLALDAGHVGIWRWDTTTGRVRWSAGVGALLGLGERVETSLDEWLDALHADDRAAMSTRLRAAAQAGAAALDAECRTADADEPKWLRVRGDAIRGTDGTASHLLGTVADVTEQRRLEARLRFADRLISTGTLAAGVAHEINNPLAYVSGNVELLRQRVATDPKLEGELEELLVDMTDGLGRIRDVVRDLRMFARPEGVDTGGVDLARVCEAAIRVSLPLVRHRARVETAFTDGVPLVRGNASRLGQVVVNLVLNAAQAMPEHDDARSPLIQVRTRAERAHAVLEVTDNGNGIPADVLPRIFDPFFTTKSSSEGTGLGLAICHGIVTAVGGNIDVESEVGRGTTFRVTLPTDVAPAETAPEAPATASAAVGRVLVVDDEAPVRRTLAILLERAGFQVVTADGPPAAREAIRADGRFDVILCDVMMPDGGAAAVLEAVGATAPALVPRVVLVTGGAVTERERDLVSRPEMIVLEKPFTRAGVLEAIARATGR